LPGEKVTENEQLMADAAARFEKKGRAALSRGRSVAKLMRTLIPSELRGSDGGDRDCPRCGAVVEPRLNGLAYEWRCPNRTEYVPMSAAMSRRLGLYGCGVVPVHPDECVREGSPNPLGLPESVTVYDREYAEECLEEEGCLDAGRAAALKADLAAGAQDFDCYLEPLEEWWG
jgi:hypothetical protein